jgi:HD-like signal output (HDOD) protein
MPTNNFNLILFVDSDQNQLQALKRILHERKDRWQLRFATTAQEGLSIMQEQAIDIIVTDSKLNDSDGVMLLKEIQSRFPGTTRMLFSGDSLRNPAQEIVHHAHQFIAKPCHGHDLIQILETAVSLRGLLNNPAMESMIGSLGTLPTLPESYQELIDALQSDSTSLADIGKIVAKDIGMSAKLLQMVNSAFFGLPRQIASPEQAVTLLGIETVTSLVLGAGVFSRIDPAVIESFRLNELWQHSQTISTLIRLLGQAHGLKRQQLELPVMAGLLHDLGKLILASQDTEEYRRIANQSDELTIPMFEAEAEALWCSHAGIGAYLMGLWGLPLSAVEAVANHHTLERQSTEHVDALLVYGANLLYHWHCDPLHKEIYNPEPLRELLGEAEAERWMKIAQEYFDGQTA